MRICFALSTFPVLSQTWVLTQLGSLIDSGQDVQVVAMAGPGEPVTHPEIDKHKLLQRTHYVSAGPNIQRNRMILNAIGYALRRSIGGSGWLQMLDPREIGGGSGFLGSIHMAKTIDRHDGFDIIHAHHGPMCVQLGRASSAGVLPAPLFATFHGSDINVFANRARPNVYERLFNSAAFCTVGSDFMRAQLLSLGAPPDRIRKIPMGLALHNIPFSPPVANKAGPLRLITVGRLVAFKGHEITINALARLKSCLPSLEYHVVGEGPLRASLQALAKKLGVAGLVHFHGGLSFDRILELYKHSHLFVLSGIQANDGSVEGQGVVLLEAQASGLPVITSDAGGAPEQIVDGKTGYSVRAGDVDDLVERIVELADHPERWRPMAQAGRQWVEQNFDNRLLVRQLVKLYREAG